MTGIVILMTICIFAGNYLARRSLERVRILETVILMIRNIRTQIEYARLPIEQLLDFLEKNSDFKKLTFISNSKKLLSEGESFQNAWSYSINNFYENSPLKDEDKNLLIAFSTGFGSSDTSGQLNNCDTYINLLEMKTQQLRDKCDSSVKIYNSLGLLCGTLVAIILF